MSLLNNRVHMLPRVAFVVASFCLLAACESEDLEMFAGALAQVVDESAAQQQAQYQQQQQDADFQAELRRSIARGQAQRDAAQARSQAQSQAQMQARQATPASPQPPAVNRSVVQPRPAAPASALPALPTANSLASASPRPSIVPQQPVAKPPERRPTAHGSSTVTDDLAEDSWRVVAEVGGVTVYATYHHELRDQVISRLKVENANDYPVYVGMTPKYVCKDGSSHQGGAGADTIGAHGAYSGGFSDYACKSSVPGAIGFASLAVTPN